MAKGCWIVLCFATISAVYSETIRSTPDELGYFYFQLENGTIITEYLNNTSGIRRKSLGVNDVSLYLYTKKTGENHPCKLTSDSQGCSNWKNCGYDPRKRTIVIIHGYTNSYLSESVQVIAKAYLKKKDCNIIVVDYYPISSPYMTALWYSKDIGDFLARAFTFLNQNCGQDLTIIECVGFSMGAHLCGLFCARLPHLCFKIVGLDAAAPVIGMYGPDGKLGIEDAHFVIALHTSDILGITYCYGHVDFFPNGGCDQWGCDSGQYLIGVCDHSASCTIWADSILDEYIFRAHYQCSSADDAYKKNCSPNYDDTYMGEITPRDRRGIYLVDTNLCYEG